MSLVETLSVGALEVIAHVSSDDVQIRSGTGQTSFGAGPPFLPCLLPSVFAKEVYRASTLCHPGGPSVLPSGPAQYAATAGRLVGSARSARPPSCSQLL